MILKLLIAQLIGITFITLFSNESCAQSPINANSKFLIEKSIKLRTVKGNFKEQDYRRILIDSLIIKKYNTLLLSGAVKSFKRFEQFLDKKSLDIKLPYALEISDIEGDTSVFPTNLDEDNIWYYSPNKFIIPGEIYINKVKADNILHLDNITITGAPGKMSVKRIESRGVAINNLKVDNLIIDSISSGLIIGNSKIDHINLRQILPSNRNGFQKITIAGCNMKDVSFEGDMLPRILFLNDTISKQIIFDYNKSQDILKIPILEIKDSYFDGSIVHLTFCKFNKLIFDNVHFGNNADLTRLHCDTIVFRNCGLLPKSLSIDLINSGKTYLGIDNTDFQDVRFSFREGMNLYFEYNMYLSLANRISGDDFASSTYQMLIDKFKKEGKSKSLELVDIDYTEWKAANGNIKEKVTTFFSKIWWYYGYRKWLILVWTFFLVILFYHINKANWKKVHETYPIVSGHSNTGYKKDYVIFYTILVFFSLRIDFDKLTYDHLKFVYLFFLQYFLGLICLFFILNAIFRI